MHVHPIAPFPFVQSRVRHSCPLTVVLSDGLSVATSVDSNEQPRPDWSRLTILFLWYLAGVPTAYLNHSPCSLVAPGIWARTVRVLIEGIVSFAFGSLIYVSTSLTVLHV
ncbi:hypothetical protein BC834DRAFT_365969 [Gloeopeniophorella convolvens]|nr:hypothetical protein BC834DRAFT_365969 [Gloeopeniophorella convolvens]